MTMMIASPQVFAAIRDGSLIDRLNEFSTNNQLRPFLPILVRTCVNNIACSSTSKNTALLSSLLSFPQANRLVQLMNIDFKQLDTDLKEMQLVSHKNRPTIDESTINFEMASSAEKHKLICGHLLCSSQLNDRRLTKLRKFEPFDNAHYVEESCWLICITATKLPILMPLTLIAETLIAYDHGPYMIAAIVANFPDALQSVLDAILRRCSDDEESIGPRQRCATIERLLDLDSQKLLGRTLDTLLTARSAHVGLALRLMCRYDDESFCAHLLRMLTDNGTMPVCVYMQKGAARAPVMALRQRINDIIRTLIGDEILDDNRLAIAIDVMRLMAALRSFASFRVNSDEAQLWLGLLTIRVNNCAHGAQMLTIALCTLLTCHSLLPIQIGDTEHKAEQQLVGWLRWLLESEEQFRKNGNSYSDLLMLIAIQFHANQTVSDQLSNLVVSVLGFKVTVAHKTYKEMRNLFLTELNNEQQLKRRIANIAVTPGLNASMPGYLPAHCITQLLSTESLVASKQQHNISKR